MKLKFDFYVRKVKKVKYTEVELIPVFEDDREQFILDNQWSFKHGALY